MGLKGGGNDNAEKMIQTLGKSDKQLVNYKAWDDYGREPA